MRITVTGFAGFIGFHLTAELLSIGHEVQGIDSLTDYYSVDLKKKRIQVLDSHPQAQRLHCKILDINDETFALEVRKFQPEVIIHLAAQAGVRQGLAGIHSYSKNNIEGFLRVLEVVKDVKPNNFLFASSSSVYGESSVSPFQESELQLIPTSIYGITKLANELFVRSILKNSTVRSRGLRFFTVYGPYGRPDMAYFRAIASSICELEFQKFGSGDVKRDFTFVSDVVDSIIMLENELQHRQEGYLDIVNIGGGNPVSINDMLTIIEKMTRKNVIVRQRNSVNEDLPITFCDSKLLRKLTGKQSFVSLEDGIQRTLSWFEDLDEVEIRNWLQS